MCCQALDQLNQNWHLDRGRNASAGVSDETDEARLPISDYRLHDYRLAGLASITGYDYRRLRLPITITNDYRLRFAAIRLAITISRGPLIDTPARRRGWMWLFLRETVKGGSAREVSSDIYQFWGSVRSRCFQDRHR